MPLFKAWDIYRRKWKAVAASGYNEFVIGGEKFASVYCQIFPYHMFMNINKWYSLYCTLHFNGLTLL
jgi:hypothetical protein